MIEKLYNDYRYLIFFTKKIKRDGAIERFLLYQTKVVGESQRVDHPYTKAINYQNYKDEEKLRRFLSQKNGKRTLFVSFLYAYPRLLKSILKLSILKINNFSKSNHVRMN